MTISPSFRSLFATISMLALTLTMSAPAAFADDASSTPADMASSTPSFQTVPPTPVETTATTTTATSTNMSGTSTSTATTTTTTVVTTSSSTMATSSTPDTTQPTGMFASNSSFHTGDNPIPFSVTFSEPIMGLMSSFFNIGNGSVTNFNGSGSYYTFDVIPGAPSGSVSVDLNGDRVTDAAGNRNQALPQIQRIIDNTLPNNYSMDSGNGSGTSTGTGTGTTTGNGGGTATSTGSGGNGGSGSVATSSTVMITSGPADGSYTASSSVSFSFTGPIGASYQCAFGSVTTMYGCSSPQVFSTMYEGTYTFTVTATNPLGATSTDSRTFTVDHTAPILSEVSPIASSTSATPTYMFTSNEVGTITYGGSCSSANTAAVSGVNTITLNTLANGDYSDCTITVTDTAGNMSAPLAITSFTVDAPVALQASGSNGGGGGNGSGGGESGGGRSESGNGGGGISEGNGGGISTTTATTGTSGGTSTGTTGGNSGSGLGTGTTGTTGSVLGDSTSVGSIDTGSSTIDIASTSSTTLPVGPDGSQAAASGLARVPAILWGLLLLLIIAIIGGTWYYRRETRQY